MSENPHSSVLLQECLEIFNGHKITTYIDATLGAAGHAEAILKAHPEIETFIGIDQDVDALALAKERLAPWKEKVHFVKSNFRALKEILTQLQVESIDGILFDLGVSSMQLDRPDRGFSFMSDGPLDMRMDRSQDLTAATIVNEWPEEELLRIFRLYGEEPQARKAARTIVNQRKKAPFKTTKELADFLHPVLYRPKKKIHPATLVFQALRICVNGELDVIEETIPFAIKKLAAGGRIAVISFHSLEDRFIKRTFAFEASDKVDTSGIAGVFLDKKQVVKLLTRKSLKATEEEMENNSRARSARLRAVEKLS